LKTILKKPFLIMKNVFVPLTFVFFFTLLVSGCSKKNDAGLVPCSVAWATDLQPEYTVIANAAADYGQDPSLANCNALKAAYQDYVTALEPYGDCATLSGQDRDDWQKAVQDAKAEIATLCD
jgi:hypothetical protein